MVEVRGRGPFCLEAPGLLGLDQVVGAEKCPLLLALCFQACVLRSLSAWGDITKVHVGLYLGLLCLWRPDRELGAVEMSDLELGLAVSPTHECLCLWHWSCGVSGPLWASISLSLRWVSTYCGHGLLLVI